MKSTPGDVVFEVSDVKVVVDAESLKYVDGTEIDFVRQGLNEAFKFRNPNVKGECGCGESFNVDICPSGLCFLGRRVPSGYTAPLRFQVGPVRTRACAGFRFLGPVLDSRQAGLPGNHSKDLYVRRAHAFHRQAGRHPQEPHR